MNTDDDNDNVPRREDAFEQEKLAWTRDLPAITEKPSAAAATVLDLDSKSVPVPTACQARFDFSGLVIPAEAQLDTHHGLHHHGEEPERAGYTVGELMHLSRSAVPSQRCLALRILTAALTQSRLGRHAAQLAPASRPSLIVGLLGSAEERERESGDPAGAVVFLLRWCLDEAVQSRGSQATPDAGACGASLGLVEQCLAGLASLLCDTRGECFLQSSFEWPIGSTISGFALKPAARETSTRPEAEGASVDATIGEDDDHAARMAADPVACLFGATQLAVRLAWLLADAAAGTQSGLGARLSPDTVGVALPALLTRGVRHSTQLACQIFSTRTLFATLIEKFLPVITEPSCSNRRAPTIVRPARLTNAYGVPIPEILRLCRICVQCAGPSVGLALVNDFRLIDCCCSYLVCPTCSRQEDTTGSGLGNKTCSPGGEHTCQDHLPECLPFALAVELQIEALRFLSVSVSSLPSTTERLKVLMQQHLIPLLSTATHGCWNRLFSDAGNDHVSPRAGVAHRELLTRLLIAWLFCLTNVIVCLSPSRSKPSPVQTAVVQLKKWCSRLIDTASRCLQSDDTVPSLCSSRVRWTEAGLNSSLVSVAVASLLQLTDLSRVHLLDPSSPPFIEQAIDAWSHVQSLFLQPAWSYLLTTFIRHESIFTGLPKDADEDLDFVTVPSSWTDESVRSLHHHQQQEPGQLLSCSLDDRRLVSPAHGGEFESMLRLHPRCLPDLGVQLALRPVPGHQSADGNPTTPSVAMAWWPKLTTSSRRLPLLASQLVGLEHVLLRWRLHLTGISCLVPVSVLTPLLDWLSRLAGRDFFLWRQQQLGREGGDTPSVLVAVEGELAARIMLLLASILQQSSSLLALAVSDRLSSLAVRDNRHTGGDKTPRADTTADLATSVLQLLAVRLLPHLRGSQHQLIHRLLTEVIFLPLGSSSSPLTSPRLSNVKAIAETYVADLACLLSPSSPTYNNITAAPIGQDWIFWPILSRYRRLKVEGNVVPVLESDAEARTSTYQALTNSLCWIAYCLDSSHQLMPSRDRRCRRPWPANRLLARLYCASLAYPAAGGLGFGATGSLLVRLLSSGHVTLPAGQAVEGNEDDDPELTRTCRVASFYDLYIELVQHYTALSYGSPVLANLLLWPCQQGFHVKYRRALWGEHQTALASIRLRLDQLLHPLAKFLAPEETDESLLRLYASALVSGGIRLDRQPVLFLVALHHLNRYLYNRANADSEFVRQFATLLRVATATGWKAGREVVDLIRCYRQPSVDCRSPVQPTVLFSLSEDLGVDDPLVDIVVDSSSSAIVCYATEELPPHRVARWESFLAGDTR